ncbi:DUF2141 domain-containing protein [Phormidium sp. FACHB-592]|uniref:DUF2141 domain-containing protein n=1 Tax=Stenomitos frigidus AS-A4 TaxID=2933935 RepID=A0ABV0KJH0_9CYAN|nr:DUF2141 domain-containing protein [Phormidium sp. FACHB-592]MBD2074483.1 DUF2141 domain-containing protein [Phormidium sp. FACHB-592]
MLELKNIRMGAIALAALSSIAIASDVKAELKSTLTIEIDGLKAQKGAICFKLFSRSFGFPDNAKNAVMNRCVKVTEDSPKITFKDISSGSYALALFQDVNGDRKLNRNTTGIPTEGYGFSNNPATRQDLTRYGDCVFLLAGASRTLKIQMKYAPQK